MGGLEAERLLLDDVSIGAEGDLQEATRIARDMVECYGFGGKELAMGRYRRKRPSQSETELSQSTLQAIDVRVRELLDEARKRAVDILTKNRELIIALRDLLLEKKVVDSKTLGEMMAQREKEK